MLRPAASLMLSGREGSVAAYAEQYVTRQACLLCHTYTPLTAVADDLVRKEDSHFLEKVIPPENCLFEWSQEGQIISVPN